MIHYFINADQLKESILCYIIHHKPIYLYTILIEDNTKEYRVGEKCVCIYDLRTAFLSNRQLCDVYYQNSLYT